MLRSGSWYEYRICGERGPDDEWTGNWKCLPDGEITRDVRQDAVELGRRNPKVWIEIRRITVSDEAMELVVG